MLVATGRHDSLLPFSLSEKSKHLYFEMQDPGAKAE